MAPFGHAVSEEKIFLTLANQKQELPLAEWDEMKKLYRGPYIHAFCQVWFHLVQFQRSRLKYEKLTNGRRTPSDGNTSHDPSGELKRSGGCLGRDLQLPVQSVPVTTKVVSSNPAGGEVYLIQHYVIKLVSDRLVVFSGFCHQ